MQPPFLSLRDASCAIGDKRLFKDSQCQLYQGNCTALVGRNGAGKSTLMHILAGKRPLDDGEIFVQPGCKRAFLPQEPHFPEMKTIGDVWRRALDHDEALMYKIPPMAETVGLDPDRTLSSLSGGELKTVDIGRVLLENPDILFMDEPTNHLDIRRILWLEKTLQTFRGASMIISHDRAFLAHVTNRLLWLHRQTLHSYKQGFATFETFQEQVFREEEQALQRQKKHLAQEERWLERGVTARRKRNQGRLKQLQALRARLSSYTKDTKASMTLEGEDATSRMILEAKNISKSYEDVPIVKDFSLRLVKKERLGIFGPNGCGKSTLIKMLTQQIKPDSGSLRLAKTLTPDVIDQRREDLNPKASLKENLAGKNQEYITVGPRLVHVMGYLKTFHFDPKNAQTPAGILSGGEQNRLLLAKKLACPSAFLILDEPTNDLDLETLDLLIELLSDYEGTLILVSHDRDFMDRLVTSTLMYTDRGTFQRFYGGPSAILEKEKLAWVSQGMNLGSDAKTKPQTQQEPRQEKQDAFQKKQARLSFKEKWVLEKGLDALKDLEEDLKKAYDDLERLAKNPQHHEEVAHKKKDIDALETQRQTLEQSWIDAQEKQHHLEQQKKI